MKRNIVLVGFMASGKTRISKILSKDLEMDVVCTDDLIEEREGRKISEIFKDSGEAYFRKIEKEIVKECSLKDKVVIDCGGGVVIDPENIEKLKISGTVFFLSASPELILERIKTEGHRPLLQVEDPLAKINELLSARKSFYEKADHTIEVDGKSLEEVAKEIKNTIK